MFGKSRSAAKPAAPAPNSRSEANASKPTPTAAAPGTTPNKLSPEEAQKRVVATTRVSVAFAQIVSVLMRSPLHKHFSLADLEWLAVPPLLTGQCRVIEAKAQADGPGVPVAAVLWASVSPEVDKRLVDSVNAPVRLRPDEWKSGEILWLIEAVGDQRVIAPVLKQLSETTLKGREVKLRARGKDGKTAVSTLQAELAAAAAAATAAAQKPAKTN